MKRQTARKLMASIRHLRSKTWIQGQIGFQGKDTLYRCALGQIAIDLLGIPEYQLEGRLTSGIIFELQERYPDLNENNLTPIMRLNDQVNNVTQAKRGIIAYLESSITK